MARPSKTFPSHRLVPSGGEIYTHLFENNSTGLTRNLFWSITVGFQPLRYGGDEHSCSLLCEWIAWPLRDWRELDGRQLEADYSENKVASSFYMGRHLPATQTRLSLGGRRDNVFSLKVDLLVDFPEYCGGDANPPMPVHAEVDVPFLGLLVIPGNLFPKPSLPAELRAAAAAFVDLSAYQAPRPWKAHGFVFRPVGFIEADPSESELE